jgi:hypothetical protein
VVTQAGEDVLHVEVTIHEEVLVGDGGMTREGEICRIQEPMEAAVCLVGFRRRGELMDFCRMMHLTI